ncbi:hypothetical protein JCM3770_006092 [Rhodotorula araucariae]
MQCFGDLPPELVAHIVGLSATPTDPSNPLECRRARRHLGALSLVHSTWTPIAQRILLGVDPVRLYHAREYSPFAALACGPHARWGGLPRLVKSLDLELWGEQQDNALAAVLRACESLDELTVACVDRAHLRDFAVGQNLAALSFRQCTLVSDYFPLVDPPPSNPLSPPPSFASLTSLDLRLCSIRRDFLPFSTHPMHRPLPNLEHLLLHAGSHDQSTATVRALVVTAAPSLRSLSLDYTAEGLLFPAATDADIPALQFPRLRTVGLYWDAGYARIAGSALLAPGPGHPALPARPPQYVHLALYPSGLRALRAALVALLASGDVPWRSVEHVRVEGTLRDLDRSGEGSDDDEDEEDRVERVRDNDVRDERELPTDAVLRAAGVAGVDLVIEDAPCQGVHAERATFARGFTTSWWRFVREVQRERVKVTQT